jgi:Zn-dependent protease with chaperone function
MSADVRYAARYFDGRTARPQSVRISIGSDGISIYRDDGVFIAAWQPDRIVLPERPRRDEPVRIGLDGTTARLVVDDPSVSEALLDAFPRANRRVRTNRRGLLKIAAWSMGAIASAVILVLVIIPLLSEQLARQTPDPIKKRIGAAALEQVVELIAYLPGERQRAAYCADRNGVAALRRLEERIFAGMVNPPEIKLMAVKASLVNAFALPGGYVVVTDGLLENAESPDEVAGVIAHEIGHVVYDHPTQAIFRTTAVSLLVSAVIGDFTGGVLIGAVAEWALNSSYSRDAEREADEFAITRLNAAAIGGTGLVRFFERLLKTEGPEEKGAANFVSSHPPTAERIARIRKLAIAGTPDGFRSLDAESWRSLKSVCQKTEARPPAFPSAAAK